MGRWSAKDGQSVAIEKDRAGTGYRGIAPILILLLMALAACQESLPDEWSRFRGPNGSGVTESTNLPVRLGPELNVIWKTPLPPGHSSPVLDGQRVFLTAVDGDILTTFCLDRETGEVLWRREAPRPRSERLDKRNNAAAPTPVTDDKGVYVFFGDYGLIAYDLEGNERWQIPLGPFDNAYGMGSSPIVVGDRVLLVCDQSSGSFMMAVHRDDGRVLWEVERPEAKTGHSTPILYRPETGPVQLLAPGSFFLTAYSVETGEKIWWVRGLPFEMKAVPVIGGDTVYIHGSSSSQWSDSYGRAIPDFSELLPEHDRDQDERFAPDEIPDELARRWIGLMDLDADGYLNGEEWNYYQAARATNGGMWAFRLGGSGDMTDNSFLWHHDQSVPQLPSSLLYKDILYMVNDSGIVTSFDPESGEVISRGRIEGAIDNFFASPVAADNKIYLVSELGKVVVLTDDGSLEVLAVNDLDDLAYATPAISQGQIFIRTRSALYSFGLQPVGDRGN
ncbi:MAG: hypothetical protein CMI32_06545 [Opitutales bacterium]|nr:hypothetical protein [Opitutales bacterium]